jgi:hypothetical protein
MPIQIECVDVFVNRDMEVLVAKEIESQVRNHVVQSEHWNVEISTSNSQFLLTVKGPHRRPNLPPPWTFGGTEGGRDGEVYAYHAAVEIGHSPDVTPSIDRMIDLIRGFLALKSV